jgi:hypothetical protein
MDHHSVLYIYFAPDPDAIDIAPHYGVEPDAGVVSYFHIADDGGIGGDKTILAKLREFAFYRKNSSHCRSFCLYKYPNKLFVSNVFF